MNWIDEVINYKEELIEIANYVTEMKCIKHPFREGIPSRIGIEL